MNELTDLFSLYVVIVAAQITVGIFWEEWDNHKE